MTDTQPPQDVHDDAVEREIQDLARQLGRSSRGVPHDRPPSEGGGGSARRVLQSPVTAAALLALAIGLTVLNLLGAGPFHRGGPAPSAAEESRMARMTLQFVVEEIQAYADEHGRLPLDLDELGLGDKADLEYVRLGPGTYRVTVLGFGDPLVYEGSVKPGGSHHTPSGGAS